jgi:beta-lactamase regulating signal transducer with metallopeptidase domain
MSILAVDGHLQTLLWLLVKVSVLQAAGAVVHARLGRHGSAARRHLIWMITVVGVLLLPMVSAVLPRWQVPLRRIVTTPADTVASVERAEPAPSVLIGSEVVSPAGGATPEESARAASLATVVPWSTALPALYAAGVLLLLARLIAAQVMIRRLARRATDVSEPELRGLLLECAERMGVRRPVRLLRSREHIMPMVFGTQTPAIVLPAVADTWSQDRRRAVLRHELAHVARYDCLTQLAAEVACALYWIHPSVWWIARRLRLERELACDDRVLAAGTHPRGYAGHLLGLAYSLCGRRAPALAVSMAPARQLEGRLRAVLDPARNRAAPALRSHLAGIAIMTALLVPLAGAETAVVPADADSPKLAHQTDKIDEAPTILIQSITFVGNRAVGSGTLKRQMTGNKERRIWTRLFAGRSTYQEARFHEDKEKIEAYYRDHGYITARVGAAELNVVRDSADKTSRFVDLLIPVVEGQRYKVGEFGFDGNKVVNSDALRLMFKVEPGTYYSEQTIRQGLEKAREAYGASGYFEFTGYPDFTFRDLPSPAAADTPKALRDESTKPATGPPIVDITVRLQEGMQFFVNRLAFTGSTTKRDSLIRGEVRLVEGGVFNTEALKYSINRLNHLGYFKPIKGGTADVDVQKTPGEDNKVDVKLKLDDR